MRHRSETPFDALLRARLRRPEGAHLRLWAIRAGLGAVDGLSRALTGAGFFGLAELEQVLTELDGRTGPALVRALLERDGGTELVAHGLEHVPRNGPVVIAATHPVGTFDFIAHAGVLLPRRPDLKVVANREAQRFLGADLIVAVDLDRRDRVLGAAATRSGMKAHLEAGGALLVFGSGRVADRTAGRDGRDGRLVEPAWRKGATRASAEAGAPVVPAAADLCNSAQYYRLRHAVRRLTGSDDKGRAVASLRYVPELLGQLGRRHELYYGPPEPPGTPPERLKALAEGLVPGLYG